MPQTTTATALATRFRLEVGDSATPYTAADALVLAWLQDAIRRYGEFRPRLTSTTVAVVADTVDYAVTGAARVVSVWDLTDGEDQGVRIPFEQYEYQGTRRIRLGGDVETGTTLTVYYMGDHTIPTAVDSTVLSVDDRDARFLVLWMRACWLEFRANTKAEASDWTVAERSEKEGSAAGGMLQQATALRKQFDAELNVPCAFYSAGHPAEVDRIGRDHLAGGLQTQGPWGARRLGPRRTAP